MSVDFVSLLGQLVPEKGGGFSSYKPRSMGGPGRNFWSARRPVSLGSGVANSFEEALANDQFRFKEGGETYLISARPTDIENEYAIKVQSEAARGQQILNQSRSGNRAITSEVSTPADADLSLSAKKIGAINSGQKQFHHMMDLDSYAPFFQGRSDEEKAMMVGMLNQKGFYPGDDRRNYIGLGGNVWAKPGKGNFVDKIKGSEHQGKMHPLLSKNRREFPLPSSEEISQMSAVQAVETMLPSLVRDRAALQQVLSTRRPGLADRVSPEAQITVEDVEAFGNMMNTINTLAAM